MSKKINNKRIEGKYVVMAAISCLSFNVELFAAPLHLVQAPVVNVSKPPAPNVIVSVDDSGSMNSGGKRDALSNALKETFKEENVPDGAIRLGWQSMNACPSIKNNSGCQDDNRIKVLDSGHRDSFYRWIDWINSYTSKGNKGTPSHGMLNQAGQYLSSDLNSNSPWAHIPGEKLNPVQACRRSYTIFLSDGEWNGSTSTAKNEDNTVITFPDNVKYDPKADQSRVYRGSDEKMLADLAFKYWANDLQPNIPNKVQPKMAVRTDEKGLTPYWNPRNDPATWQHLTMYAIGFGAGAATWRDAPLWGTDTWTGTDYDQILSGKLSWGKAVLPDQWHAAINSRGRFVPVLQPVDLVEAFKSILNEILSDNNKPVSSISLSATTTRTDSFMFSATYDPMTWSGSVSAQKIKAGDATVDTVNFPWGGKNTAEIMAAKPENWYLNRKIIGSQSDGSAIDWTWTNLDDIQKRLLNASDNLGESRIKYIRGDQSKEIGKTGGVFRQRESIHGDIVNSNIWYMSGNNYRTKTKSVDRPNMVYVGGNDGMLHAFNGADGQELLAYIPKGVVGHLPALTDPNYQNQHRYYVDGSPFTGDVFTHSKNFDGTDNTDSAKSYLAGFLGAGGRGYFLLDVTAPQNFSNARASDVLVMDKTIGASEVFDATDARAFVGHITSEPVTDQVDTRVSNQLVRMNDGRWALVMGNGYNSQNEQAALLIQFLEGSKELKVLKASSTEAIGNANGLAAPRLLDLNNDGAMDVAYAGDLHGNLWKFDLTSSNPAQWKTSFAGQPLFQARKSTTSGAVVRPITAAPAFAFHPDGGVILMAGTGRLLTESDRSSIDREYIFAVRDASSISIEITQDAKTSLGAVRIGEASSDRAAWGDLVELTTTAKGDSWNLSGDSIDYKNKKGWIVQLPVAGSRVVQNSQWVIGERFRVPFVLPAQGGGVLNEETCDPQYAASKHYLATVEIRTATQALPPKKCDAQGNCKEWTREPELTPVIKDPGGVPARLLGPDGSEHLLPDGEVKKIFDTNPLYPSWRPIQ
ncbi:hypothetical protein E9531_12155 [Lampropedia puyangensis]|uniref:PilY1 beta-propeller domain-containing protein n=1 Tax=Lampropedia puyangensis TaxID=1330072 RepID=A0A4V4GQR6_9BURK|nr:PilC/PilY family type IV pilus protein [Lampropedia puyangensis]THT99325.1 hypothetical protein E9531_12155 [Lampropedia puyangensis]